MIFWLRDPEAKSIIIHHALFIMKFLEPYYYEADAGITEERLLEKLVSIADMTGNSFSISPSEKFSIRGVAEVHGRLVQQKTGIVVHAHISASRNYRLSAIVWIVVAILVFGIGLVNEIKFHYFHPAIFFIAAIGALGHLVTIALYKASVRANIQFLNELISGR